MEGKFEKFVRDHRSELDDKTPPENTWLNIERKLESSRPASYLRYWQAAAVLFFVVSLGLFIKNYQPNETELVVSETVQEFETTEEYYFELIESQQGVLTSYLGQYPDLASDFKNDLEELSQNYNKLKADFEATGDMEVLHALINNLQLQQKLLSNQLNIIQQIEQENENVSI